MTIQTFTKASTILLTFLILLVQVPASAVDQVASAGGEKGNREIIAHQKVNINTADTARLTTLTGVGTQLAKRISEFRKQNGPFEKAEDIMQVKGVGKKSLTKTKIVLF